MQILAAVHELIHAAGGPPPPPGGGGPIPDPPPAAPLPGSTALTTMVGWLKWGSLLCCLAAAVMAGGMIAVGNTSRRAELAERGKVTLICALLGSVVIGIGGTLVTTSYGLG